MGVRSTALRAAHPVATCSAVLLWINAYICRDWFTHPTAWMNSLHGYQIALARYGGVSLSPSWWPFWDCGMPMEFASAPLVPALAAMRHGSPLLGYQSVSAIFYCAAPVALFLLAWSLTRATFYSFFAALFYSLLSPAQILVPEGVFAWAGFLSPHRFKLQAVWDETPHCAALTFLLLFLMFLSSGGRRSAVLSSISLALALLAWPFAIVPAALSALCLLTAQRKGGLRAAAIGAGALLLSARFLPPSLWLAMVETSSVHDGWNAGFLKWITGLALVWCVLEHFLVRARDWRLPFFALWVFAMSAAPVLQMWTQRQIVPQAHRLRLEMEAAIALLVIFALRPLVERLAVSARAVIAVAALLLVIPLTLDHRREAKNVLYPHDATRTLESRIAQRVAGEFPGARVLLPGSIAYWANAFTDVIQMGGGDGVIAYNPPQQRALKTILDAGPSSPAVLASYGVAAIAVPAAGSAEFWRPFPHPEQYAGLLPVLWTEEGVTLYRVPQDSVETQVTWRDRNHFSVRAAGGPIPVSYHPGWHATVEGRPVEIQRDSLGMMRLKSTQPATVAFAYDGGPELRICGWVSLAAMLAAAWYLVRGGFR